jgi:hypothetical protein
MSTISFQRVVRSDLVECTNHKKERNKDRPECCVSRLHRLVRQVLVCSKNLQRRQNIPLLADFNLETAVAVAVGKRQPPLVGVTLCKLFVYISGSRRSASRRGKEFKPDATMMAELKSAAQEGHAWFVDGLS